MASVFLAPKTIISGKDALKESEKQLVKLGKKAFIVTDSTMVKLGNVSLLQNVLDKNDIGYHIFDEVNYEPDDIIVTKASLH